MATISIRAIEKKDPFMITLTIVARILIIYILLFLMTDINIGIQAVILALSAQVYMMISHFYQSCVVL